LQSFDRALAIRPDYEQCQFNRAMLLLLVGRFAEGWQAYEWRRKASSWTEETLRGPDWSGGDPAPRHLLLYSEQALGDTIQFCRFAGMLAATGSEVILEVQPVLEGLLKSLQGVRVIRKGRTLPAYDAHLPVMSVPNVLKVTPETVPASVPYLFAEPTRIDAWAKRLPSGEFPIGIGGQGRPLQPF